MENKTLSTIKSKYNSKIILWYEDALGQKGEGPNWKNNLNLIENTETIKLGKKRKPTAISNDDVTVYIDPLSELYLLGTTIDYVNQDYKKNIFESKFVFNVDKELLSTCGCGISFTPKTTNL